MLVQTAHIEGTSRREYDALLASGWFRGTGILYRSEIVCISDQVFSVQHIRLPLVNFSPRPSHRKMMRRNDKKFRIEIGEPVVDDRKEELYAAQTSRFKAFLHQNLSDIVDGGRHDGEFDTKELRVFDGEKLIAVSYFDIGLNSMASLMCLYDQNYRTASLGIYTMLLEIEYAKQLRLEHYYPGYVLDRPSAFDYKLTLGDCSWMGHDKMWYAKSDLPKHPSKGDIFREKMAELQIRLRLKGYHSVSKIYPYFTVGQVLREQNKLLRLPCYLTFYRGNRPLAASYDPELDDFMIFNLMPAEDLEFTQQLELSDDYRNSSAYELRLMKCGFYLSLDFLHSSDDKTEMTFMPNESVS